MGGRGSSSGAKKSYTVSDRVSIARKFLDSYANNFQDKARGQRIVNLAKVWNGGEKVRIYGVGNSGYLEIEKNGTIKNQIERGFSGVQNEMWSAIDKMNSKKNKLR